MQPFKQQASEIKTSISKAIIQDLPGNRDAFVISQAGCCPIACIVKENML